MNRGNLARSLFVIVGLMLVALAGCTAKMPSSSSDPLSGELILLHAGSLAVPMRQVSELFEKKHPGVKVKAEAAGSRDTARKVSDLGRSCDVMALADYRVAEELLIPKHAKFNVRFAANEMAIAYTDRSKHAAEIATKPWYEVLLLNDVAFGRADPDRDPCGYRTEMVFQLAQTHYQQPGLAEKLKAKDARYLRPKETDLLALLESGEIDYLFIYRSVVQQHRLKMVALPREINLQASELNDAYRKAEVSIAGGKPGEKIVQKGEAIVYSVTIPLSAANRPAAEAYVALLLSPEGQAILKANGQEPIVPALVDHIDGLPEPLRGLCRQDASP